MYKNIQPICYVQSRWWGPSNRSQRAMWQKCEVTQDNVSNCYIFIAFHSNVNLLNLSKIHDVGVANNA